MKKLYLILFTFSLFTGIYAQHNFITGKVYDAKTKEPLMGVNLVVNELKGTGAASDMDGKFSIKVPYGSYSVTATLIGFRTVVKTDVIVTTASEARLNIQMDETAIETGQVVIKADYFDKSVQENDLSTVVLGAEEIRRSPGSAQDFQRILQGMAGVSFSNDQTNELLVRGGSPNENLTVFDNMEIHSTNHYPNEYNSGGPINMVNVDLIEDIQFSTGGFISKYGDKLSSVMNITSREGTRNNLYSGNLNLSMAGFGTVMEGRINGGRGSWILSARKSFLDLISSNVGLTAVPKYYDLQFKAAYDISKIHKLSWSGIYGNDKILFAGESDITKLSLAGSRDTVGVERVDVKQSQYATGLTLKSIWSNTFYSMLTVYYNNYHNDVDVDEEYTERVFDSKGKLHNSNILNKRRLVTDNHDNGQAAIKAEMVWNVLPQLEMNLGASSTTGDFTQNLYVYGDSVRYDRALNGWNTPDDTTVSVLPASPVYNIKLFRNHKDYVYINNKFKLFDNRLIVNLGARYDYFSYSDRGNFSPRLSATYYLIPGLTNINFAYGEFYQTHSYPYYGDRRQTNVNRHLKNTHARHFVLGFEHIIDDGLKLTLEGYHKKYNDIPVEEEFINFNDRTFRSDAYANIGKQTSYGIDLMIQQKLVKDIYGTLAYSRMWSRNEDPRAGREGQSFSSSFEFPHVFTVILGKRFSNLRDKISEMPFYLKYPSYILPFSNDMEISFRWRFASGKPYTPYIYTTAEQHYEGEVRWGKGAWVESSDINSVRYPDYHRLDIAFNSRYNFKTWNLVLFLSVENLYNRKNVAAYQRNSDGSVDTIYQFALFPIGGLEIEF